jgi:hypothetical protein
MAKPNKHAPLGQGGRFAAVVQGLMRQKGMSSDRAKAIAASAGRKKYGAKKMASMAARGRKK